jgi:hypothetical protein
LTVNDIVEYLEALRPFVDKQGRTGLVEYRDEIPTFEGGPTFVLVVDHAREVEIENIGVIPQIDDLKTLSDFRYCKTPDELAKDAQMVSYAKWALRLFELESKPAPDFVSVRHVYVRTRGKHIVAERSRLMSPGEIEEQWQLVLHDVKAMLLLAETVTDPMAVMPNTDHCSAYGGCFFRPDCYGDLPKNLSEVFEKKAKEKIMSGNGVRTSPSPSLMDRLRAHQGRLPAPPPAAPVAPPSSGVAVLPAPPVAPSVAAAPPVAAAAPGAPVSRLKRFVTATAASPVADVLPPDAPARVTLPADVPAEASAAAAPKKRGRPRAGVVAVGVAAAGAVDVASLAAVQAAAVMPPLVSAASQFEELYIDCLPTKGGTPYGLGEDILAQAGADAAAVENVADWRLIQYTSRGVLATAVRSLIGELPKALVVTSSVPGSDVLIEVLTPIARKVVRALRG